MAISVLLFAARVGAQDTRSAATAAAVTDSAAPETLASLKAKKCLESTCRQVPLRETLTAIGVGTPYVRALIGGFEQGAGIGGGLQLTSAHLVRGLEIRATALASARLYWRGELGVFVPSIGSSRNHADVWFSYLQRDTQFFALDQVTDEGLDTPFAITRRSYQGSVYRDLADGLQGGAYTQLRNSVSTLGETSMRTQVLIYGGFLAYDTRDNRVGLTRGLNLYARVASADGVGQHGASADYGWIESEVDARAYAPLASPRTSLLLRARALLKTPKGGGRQIPYYDLSWLGGRSFVRGYEPYRFRDRNMALLSTELQQTVYAFSGVRGLDVFASADTGQVFGEARAGAWHSALGGGVQYRHSPSVAARVEVGRSPGHTLVYVSMSRGF